MMTPELDKKQGHKIDDFYSKVDYWECISCGLLQESPISGHIIEIKTSFAGRIAKVECNTCREITNQNLHWMIRN